MCYLLKDVSNYRKLMSDAKAKPRRVTVIELKRKTHSYSVPSVFIKILHTRTHKKCCIVGYIYTYVCLYVSICVCIYTDERERERVMVLRKSHSIVGQDGRLENLL